MINSHQQTLSYVFTSVSVHSNEFYNLSVLMKDKFLNIYTRVLLAFFDSSRKQYAGHANAIEEIYCRSFNSHPEPDTFVLMFSRYTDKSLLLLKITGISGKNTDEEK